MFFGSAARKELELIKSQMEQHRQAETSAQARISELESQLSDSNDQAREAQLRAETYESLMQHLVKFGASFKLSQQSLSQMADRLKAYRDSAAETRGVSEASRGAISGIADNLQRLLELATQMERSISASTLRSFVEVAKMDHLVFKFEIYKAFFGLNSMSANDMVDQTACRLGKWYHQGDGHQCYSRLPGFREIEIPHTAVHRAGREALEALRGGDSRRGAEAIGRMEDASLGVVEALDRIAGEGEMKPELLRNSC